MLKELSNKTKELVSKHKVLFLSITLNITFLLFFMFFVKAKYETNDDTAMTYIVSGAYSSFDPYMVFSNVLIGKLFNNLFYLMPAIPWYGLIYYVITLSSFFLLTTTVLKYSENRKKISEGVFVVILLMIFFGIESYSNFNFTKLAGLLSINGFIVILLNINEVQSNSRLNIVLGGVMITLGSMIRFDSMLLAGSFAFLVYIYKIAAALKNDRKEFKKIIIKSLIIFIPVLFLSFSLRSINRNYNNEFLKYNTARAKLVDYHIPDFEGNEEKYMKIGMSANDVKMLKTWTFDDPDFFSTEKLNEISEIRTKVEYNKDSFKGTIKYMATETVSNPLVLPTVILFLMILYSKDKKNTLRVIPFLLLIILEYFYLYTAGRIVKRVEFVIWISSFLSLATLQLESKKKWSLDSLLLTATLSLFLVFPTYRDYTLKNKREKVAEESYVLDKLSNDKDNLYLIDISTSGKLSSNSQFDPFQNIEKNYFSNIISLGGWLTNHPQKLDSLKKYGVENPLKDAIDSDFIYVVDGRNYKIKEQYINEHYDETAKFVPTMELEGCTLFKVVSSNYKVDFSNAVYLDERISKSINFNNDNKAIDGNITFKDNDSFNQKLFYSLSNSLGIEVSNGIIPTYEDATRSDSDLDKFSYFYKSLQSEIVQNDSYRLTIYIEVDDILYNVGDIVIDNTI